MTGDDLRALRDKIRREQALTVEELLLRPSDDEPNWFVACLELVAEVDRLSAEVKKHSNAPCTWDVYACRPGQPESHEGTVEAATFEDAWSRAQERFGPEVNHVHPRADDARPAAARVRAVLAALPGEAARVDDARPAAARIRAILDALPGEAARVEVLEQVLENRCRRCLDYDPRGQFWCCYDSRGG